MSDNESNPHALLLETTTRLSPGSSAGNFFAVKNHVDCENRVEATAVYKEAAGRLLQRGRGPSTTRPLAVFYNEAAGRRLQRGHGRLQRGSWPSTTTRPRPSTTRPLAVVYNEATAVYNEAARADHTTTARPRACRNENSEATGLPQREQRGHGPATTRTARPRACCNQNTRPRAFHNQNSEAARLLQPEHEATGRLLQPEQHQGVFKFNLIPREEERTPYVYQDTRLYS